MAINEILQRLRGATIIFLVKLYFEIAVDQKGGFYRLAENFQACQTVSKPSKWVQIVAGTGILGTRKLFFLKLESGFE